MQIDRTAICDIISEMLDNPDKIGIYPTTVCFDKLEKYTEGVRAEAIGWTHSDNCICLDNSGDPRKKNVPEMFERAKDDLGYSQV